LPFIFKSYWVFKKTLSVNNISSGYLNIIKTHATIASLLYYPMKEVTSICPKGAGLQIPIFPGPELKVYRKIHKIVNSKGKFPRDEFQRFPIGQCK
jgi:hypothetical protein